MKTKVERAPVLSGPGGRPFPGVARYYLAHEAVELGELPQVILVGRRINNAMGQHVAQRLVEFLARNGGIIKGARVGVMGLTFKENVSDIRDSRVPDIVNELLDFGVNVLVHDLHANPEDAKRELSITLADFADLNALDALLVAVSHSEYLEMSRGQLLERIRKGGILIDVKSIFDPKAVPEHLTYWSL